MPPPQIAIVGRPNVGKSSLLNRLVRRRVSIVDPTPGVTRDRVGVVIEIDPPLDTDKGTPSHQAEIVDTGGYGIYTAEGGRYDDVGADLQTLTGDIEDQIAAAMRESAVVLFVTDAQSGLTALDEKIARLLRQQGNEDKVIPVANKVDGDNWVPHGLEMAGLGFGEPVLVAASNGRKVRSLMDTIWQRLNDRAITEADEREEAPELKIALVGQRNAGKSTMINALAGEPRVIVSEIAGTTRDAVDVRFQMDGRSIVAIDTAGVRKRKSISDRIEVYAYERMIEALRRADVALFLIDATRDISSVDKKLSKELQEQFKPTVLVITKTDLIDKKKVSPEDYLKYITQELRGLDYCPVVFVSSDDTEALQDAIDLAWNLYAQASHRVSTGELNEVVEAILKKRGPSSRLGTQAKLYFASQIETNPPTIVLKVNKPDLFEGRYERYLLNRLREELPYSEVPIKLIFSPRGRMDLDQMKQRGKRRDRANAPPPPTT